MTMVAPFLHGNRPLPFCPDEFDIDSYSWTGQFTKVFAIRDLTLEDAMALYWNMESTTLTFEISGANYLFSAPFNSGGVAIDFTGVMDGTGGGVKTPPNRVCGGLLLYGSVEDLACESVDYPTEPDETYDANFDYVFPANSPSTNNTFITVQTDDLYTFWCEMQRTDADQFLSISGGGDVNDGAATVATLLNYIDVPVLSGYVRVYGVALDNTIGAYDTGGTLDAADLVPAYYTY